jgi:GNAT superfamily N-acetyltransferase
MTITFEKAHTADHMQLTDLTFRSKRYCNYPDRYYDIWRDELTITEDYLSKNLVYTARTGGMILGYYAIVKADEDYWAGRVFIHKGYWLEHNYIRPEYIGQGIGTKLMEHALEQCRKLGIPRLYFFADPHAESFYRKFGARFIAKADSSIEGRLLPLYELSVDQWTDYRQAALPQSIHEDNLLTYPEIHAGAMDNHGSGRH